MCYVDFAGILLEETNCKNPFFKLIRDKINVGGCF